MDVILKFAALRPPAAIAPMLSLTSGSGFQRQLAEAGSAEQPRAEAGVLARRFVENDFLASVDQVANGAHLASLIGRLQAEPPTNLERLAAELLEAVDGVDPTAVAADAVRARDSVVARYLLPDGPSAYDAEILVRAYAMVQSSRAGTVTLEQIDSMLHGPLALPAAVVSLRDQASQVSPVPTAHDLAAQINMLSERHGRLAATLAEIAFHAEDELEIDELGERRPLSAMYQTSLDETSMKAHVRASKNSAPTDDQPGARTKHSLAGEVARSSLLRATARRNVVFSTRALELLPERTVATLRSLDISPSDTPISQIRKLVLNEQLLVGQQLMVFARKFAEVKTAGINDSGLLVDPAWILEPVDAPEPRPAVNTVAPASHTPVKPLGIADLMLVRAHISHYQRAEVAAVENVAGSEKLTHTVRRLDRSESTATTDQEVTDLRSLAQSAAEQYSRSVAQVAGEQYSDHTAIEAVGPAIGPLATQNPVSFAQSVTDQVSTNSTSTSRSRRLSVQRQLRETEETNEHLLDNTKGKDAKYGVYQWLDKFYVAQTFSYGPRLLYDLVVPEPAAMFREALTRPRSGLPMPVRPANFTVTPSNLGLQNWEYYATGHQASGVDAPPAAEVIVTETFGGYASDVFSVDANKKTFVIAEARSTRIPKGYRAASYRVVVQASGYNDGFVRVSIGAKCFKISGANGTDVRFGALDGERETLPVGCHAESNGVDYGINSMTVAIEIVCAATDELVMAWQVQTYNQIFQANQRRFQAYEEAVANRDAYARISLLSIPAARRVSLVATEMKRATLELLTGQSFSGFNATRFDAAGFPFPDVTATTALSAYIRFFEQAVEWERLAYVFYPYFWGSQNSWVRKLLETELDDSFARFLGSGAARVVLPIRPGYEAAFELFLNTGATPSTDQLLDVGSPLWVSLVDELRRQSGEDGKEIEVGESWQFRIATDLLRVRTDGTMPKWIWNAGQGEWRDEADSGF